jgi:hypothetical protein
MKQKGDQQANGRVKREAQKHVRSGANAGTRFVRSAKDNLPLQILGANLNKEARRRVN